MTTEYKMVPVEPTEEMIVAFAEAWYSKRQTIDDPDMLDAYRDMLAAAPASPQAAQPVAFIQIPKNLEKYGHYDSADRLHFGKPGQFFVNGESPMFDFVPLYTHVDAVEVERLRSIIRMHEQTVLEQSNHLAYMRAQLAELPADLMELPGCENTAGVVACVEYIEQMLSAIAAPAHPCPVQLDGCNGECAETGVKP